MPDTNTKAGEPALTSNNKDTVPLGRDAAVGYRLGSSSSGGVIVRGTSTHQLRPGGNLMD